MTRFAVSARHLLLYARLRKPLDGQGAGSSSSLANSERKRSSGCNRRYYAPYHLVPSRPSVSGQADPFQERGESPEYHCTQRSTSTRLCSKRWLPLCYKSNKGLGSVPRAAHVCHRIYHRNATQAVAFAVRCEGGAPPESSISSTWRQNP
jgi:hypothetical protein